MFASLAFVFLFGLMGAAVFEKMKLPRIIGMLLAVPLAGIAQIFMKKWALSK